MKRQYCIHTQAWWASANPLPAGVVEAVNFGLYYDLGCLGEAQVSWHALGRGRTAPRIEVFDDAWSMLAALTAEGLIERLAELDSSDATPQQFCELLGQFGFEDATPREAPMPVRSEEAASAGRPDDERTNAQRAARARPHLDAYRTGPLAGDPDDETAATDLVVDVLHALGDAGAAARVLRVAWGHYGYETGANDAPLPVFAALVAAVADYRAWLARVTDEAGEPRPGTALGEFDADRTDAWRAIVDAALDVASETER